MNSILMRFAEAIAWKFEVFWSPNLSQVFLVAILFLVGWQYNKYILKGQLAKLFQLKRVVYPPMIWISHVHNAAGKQKSNLKPKRRIRKLKYVSSIREPATMYVTCAVEPKGSTLFRTIGKEIKVLD